MDKYLNKKFNEWTPIKKVCTGKYLCRCSCGIEKEQYIKNIVSGSSKSCGHERKLTGKTINSWTILEELGGGKVKVQCSCGTIAERYKKAIISGQSKSCGCKTKYRKNDLCGKRFNSWIVIEPAGNGYELCRCDCGTVKVISRASIINGTSSSCGCKQGDNLKQSLMERYGDISVQRINNPREEWQIKVLNDSNKLESFIKDTAKKQGYKPTTLELSKLLDTNTDTILLRIHNAGLDDYVDIGTTDSAGEKEIYDYIITLIPADKIIRHDRTVLNNKELDIYIPEYKLAIEFNGAYWHSDLFKSSNYHQEKTISCMNKGIQLIHIFDFEWNNNITKEKIKSMLKSKITKDTVIYARNTYVKSIEKDIEKAFLDSYHIQNYVSSAIAYGLYNNENNELLSVMTFGVPRFSNNYEYELVRYCVKAGYTVIGGSAKLFKYFVNEYSPKSILTYADASKFTGQIYSTLGFTKCKDSISKPSYVWVNLKENKVLTRYQTQKQRLITMGLGEHGNTEDEIMKSLGYYKVYNCGNFKFEYNKK